MLAKRGLTEEAKANYEEAVSTLADALGEQHLQTALLRQNYGVFLSQSGESEQSIENTTRSLAALQELLGPAHPQTAQAHALLAGQWTVLGDYELAERHYLSSLEAESRFGLNLMSALPESQAMQYVERVYRARDRLLGLGRASRKFGPAALLRRIKSIPIASDREVYEAVWYCKALATRASAIKRPRTLASEEQWTLWHQLNLVRRELATTSVAIAPTQANDSYIPRLEQLTREKEELELRIGQLNKAWDQDQRTYSFAEVVRQLPDGIAVVDFIRAEKIPGTSEWVYEAFVYWNHKQECVLRWVHLGSADPIDNVIAAFLRINGDRGIKRVDSKEILTDPGSRLKTLVWDRISPHLGGCRTVVIIPDGPLARVPWLSLPSCQTDRYLIDDFAITTTPFLEYPRTQIEKAKRTSQVLLVGDVDYKNTRPPTKIAGLTPFAGGSANADDRWSDLPGTKREIDLIRMLTDSSATHVLRKTEAKTDSVVQELVSADYVHFATHGFAVVPPLKVANTNVNQSKLALNVEPANGDSVSIRSRNPLTRSGLVLATQSSLDDGLLTGEEIVGLDLNDVKLVVLSACDTGLGEVPRGEGVLALQRAFRVAGARQVIASLWKVDDAATEALMIDFYKRLWKQGKSVETALREAQQGMIAYYDPIRQEFINGNGETETPKRMLPPRYWAAFVLHGALPAAAIAPPIRRDIPSGYQEFRPVKSGYSICFPEQDSVTEATQEFPSALGSLTVSGATVDSKSGIKFVVASTDYPWAAKDAASPKQRLDEHVKATVNMVAEGVIKHQELIRHCGRPGREVVVHGTAQRSLVRIYLVESQVIVVAANVPNEQSLEQESVQQFHDSFVLINEAAAKTR